MSKTLDECNCLYFSNFGLPCRHIFACRKKENIKVFDQNFISKRWQKEFANIEPTLTSQTSVTVNKGVKSKTRSVTEKIDSANEICRDIATFLSTCGEKEFHEKLTFLKYLKTDWQCLQISNLPVTDEVQNKRETSQW